MPEHAGVALCRIAAEVVVIGVQLGHVSGENFPRLLVEAVAQREQALTSAGLLAAERATQN